MVTAWVWVDGIVAWYLHDAWPVNPQYLQFVRDALARILRKAKADRVGTAIADLTICGAIPPYNEVLGGKLLAMLMMSPEVVAEYCRR